jgi:hypothetical protein
VELITFFCGVVYDLRKYAEQLGVHVCSVFKDVQYVVCQVAGIVALAL